MLWIITGHSYSFAMQWLFFRNPQTLKSASKTLASQIFANGTFSVDCFFFLSGFLLAYLALKEMQKNAGKFNLLAYWIHRYVRLTPLMLAVIAFSATLLRYMGQGPAWLESIVMFDKWCKDNWWINALYLHNFVNRENMVNIYFSRLIINANFQKMKEIICNYLQCLSHSWYSAVDMQFYLFAPIILVPLYKKPRVGIALLLLALFASMGITGYITFVRHLPAVPYFNDLV
ncbi:nose resistant to fluoxetine protein 6-like protein [Dinothrombium tinctorium]|uniref:Nose resistant to fluoxetine protein 6-like protein n=1 Tax=Dinothrombium tinctorium TaxID=1965070 RepID=A0A443RBF7_9ACAR|nr:nose resistant to fluoxetine protein 6-like protein [Dinothrombium tinctorium]